MMRRDAVRETVRRGTLGQDDREMRSWEWTRPEWLTADAHDVWAALLAAGGILLILLWLP